MLSHRRCAGSCVKTPQTLWRRSSSFLLPASSSSGSSEQVVLVFVRRHIGVHVSHSSLCEWCITLPGTLRYSEVLSSDLQKNILAALLRLGAVRKIKGYVGFDRAHVPAAFSRSEAFFFFLLAMGTCTRHLSTVKVMWDSHFSVSIVYQIWIESEFLQVAAEWSERPESLSKGGLYADTSTGTRVEYSVYTCTQCANTTVLIPVMTGALLGFVLQWNLWLSPWP